MSQLPIEHKTYTTNQFALLVKPHALLLLIITLFFSPTLAQLNEQDSLDIVEQLDNAHSELIKRNYDEAIKLAKKVQANKVIFRDAVVNSSLLIAESYKLKQDYSNSLNYYLQAFAEIEKGSSKEDLKYINLKLGELFYDWGVPEKALSYFNTALSFQDESSIESISLLNRLAETHIKLDQQEEALDKYQKILSIQKNQKIDPQILLTLKKIALINMQLNDFQNALIYNFEILEINKKARDSLNIAVSLNTIGFIYKDLNNFKKALEYFNAALIINKRLNSDGSFDNNIVSNLINLGVISQSLGDTRNSVKYFNDALKIKQKRGTAIEIAVMHNYLASINYTLGKNKEAEQHTRMAIDLLEGSDNKRMLASNYKRLSDINQKQSNYREALKNYEQYSILKDSLLYREQLAGEKEKYKQYIAGVTEKESKLNIIDREMQALELRNEKVKSEQVKQKIELLLRERELQGITLKNDRLENERQVQQLLLQQEQIDAKRKDQEIELLEQKRDLQAIEIQKNELLRLERQREIELQNSKLELQQAELAGSQIRQNYLIWTAILSFSIFLLILLGYAIKQRDNKKLQGQYNEINEQKLKIEKINQKLIDLNEEKNDLIGIVAHDLKSPLNQISGILDLIKLTSKNQSEEQQDYISKIDQSAQRLKRMVTKILDVNAIEAQTLNINLEPLDLGLIMKEVLERFDEMASKKEIKVDSDICEHAVVNVDQALVSEVFENLISNAIKYSPIGKTVTIRLQKLDKKIRAEFIDQGQGISEQDMGKLFGKYHKLTARPTAGEDSTGLGLSIVKKYVEALSGKVWCESEEGRGAIFIVEFEGVAIQSAFLNS